VVLVTVMVMVMVTVMVMVMVMVTVTVTVTVMVMVTVTVTVMVTVIQQDKQDSYSLVRKMVVDQNSQPYWYKRQYGIEGQKYHTVQYNYPKDQLTRCLRAVDTYTNHHQNQPTDQSWWQLSLNNQELVVVVVGGYYGSAQYY